MAANVSSPSTYLSLGSQQVSGGASPVTPPIFSQKGATLTMSDATSGATIYYTTDGSTPTTSSPVYSGPISLSTSTYGTTYTYDVFNHLIQVSMPRPSGTQTRSFLYSGNDLVRTTNPENGVVNYTYDINHRLLTKTDAKGQQIVNTYDSYGRLTEIQRYYLSSGTLTEDTTQQVLYSYDTNPYNGSYSQYAAGRLAAIKYYGGNCTSLGPPRAGCDTIQEWYSYNIGGAAVGKCVVLIRGSSTYPNLCGSWTYDTEGRMTAVTYPAWTDQYLGAAAPGPSYAYAYDTMGRLNTMTDQVASTTLISGVTYGVANEVQAISGSFFNETRSYNSLFQLAQITVPGALNIQYAYSSTMNNGKVASQTDVISGEQVVYTYDALNRLATAQTVTNPGVTQWGQSYNYDGFGNLTAQNVIKGSAPTMSVTYNAATNRQSGDTADANGNLGSGYVYDIVNRLLQASGTTMQYAYDSGNKRVWRGDGSTLDEIAFWGVNGQKLATYHPYYDYTLGALTFGMTFTDVYFGSRLIGKGTVSGFGVLTVATVASDRLGSIGKFYPYGIERPSATTNDTEKFTGYYRDAATGLDYADQRYHQPGVGRFMTPDQASANSSDPGSWNRYAYTRGDPVNRRDPNGTCDVDADGLITSCDDGGDFSGFSFGTDGCAWSQYLCPGYIQGIITLGYEYLTNQAAGCTATISEFYQDAYAACPQFLTVQNMMVQCEDRLAAQAQAAYNRALAMSKREYTQEKAKALDLYAGSSIVCALVSIT